METGKFKHRIKILDMQMQINEEGGYEEVPTTIATPFCEIAKSTIKEFRQMDLEGRTETLDFIIRYMQKVTITSGMQVEFKGKQYKIVAIEPDYQDEERQLLKCEVDS